MSAAFDLYAACYDLLYRGKDYAAEARHVADLVRAAVPGAGSLIELGSGTGIHALELARLGFRVHGVDLSARMVERALARREQAGALAQQLSFEAGNVCSVRTGRRFDAAISLFHVVSYHTTDAELAAAFETARAHLAPGGAFVFDFWYGPAVLSDRPRAVEKSAADERVRVERRTRPEMHVNQNRVDVHFDLTMTDLKGGQTREFRETHRMRYLFLPELERLLGGAGFEHIEARQWMSGRELDDSTWYGCIVARAAGR